MLSIFVEQDCFEIEIQFEYEIIPGDKGKYTGPWEDSYPSTPAELDQIYNAEVLVDGNYESDIKYTIANMRVKEKLANGDFYDEKFEQAAFADFDLKEKSV